MPEPVVVPEGPYLYDDPRFIYDEPCMFYNGGFDLQCLVDRRTVILPKKIGGSSSAISTARRKKQLPPKDCRVVVDFVLKTEIHSVNNKPIEHNVDNFKEVKYHLEYEPIKVTANDLRHKIDNFKVWSYALSSSIVVPKICFTNKVKVIPIKTIVSSSIESQIRKSKLLIKGEVVERKKKK